VRELIYKRGYGKVDGNRVPLTDNKIIEQVGTGWEECETQGGRGVGMGVGQKGGGESR
jgi:hypothetical protein